MSHLNDKRRDAKTGHIQESYPTTLRGLHEGTIYSIDQFEKGDFILDTDKGGSIVKVDAEARTSMVEWPKGSEIISWDDPRFFKLQTHHENAALKKRNWEIRSGYRH